MDAHCHAFSKFAGAGHYGGKRHNAMEDALSDSARSAGINAAQQLETTYVNDVDHRRCRAFGQMQRPKSSQRPTGGHGIMVPDVAFENFVSSAAAEVAAHGGRPRSYDFDVKTCGYVEHLYSPMAGRGVPMGPKGPSSGATGLGLLSRAWPSASTANGARRRTTSSQKWPRRGVDPRALWLLPWDGAGH